MNNDVVDGLKHSLDLDVDTVVDPLKAGQSIVEAMASLHLIQFPTEVDSSDIELPHALGNIDLHSDHYVQALAEGRVPEDCSLFFQGDDPYLKLNWEKGQEVDFLKSFMSNANEFQMHSLLGMVGLYCHVYMSWVRQLAGHLKDKRVLEIGAGQYGYLSYALGLCGIECIATDPLKGGHADYSFVHVHKLNYKEALNEFSSSCDVLLTAWAPMQNWPARMVDIWKKSNPDGWTVIVGETGGCTGSNKMYRALESDELVYFERIRRLKMIKDRVEVFAPVGR